MASLRRMPSGEGNAPGGGELARVVATGRSMPGGARDHNLKLYLCVTTRAPNFSISSRPEKQDSALCSASLFDRDALADQTRPHLRQILLKRG